MRVVDDMDTARGTSEAPSMTRVTCRGLDERRFSPWTVSVPSAASVSTEVIVTPPGVAWAAKHVRSVAIQRNADRAARLGRENMRPPLLGGPREGLANP